MTNSLGIIITLVFAALLTAISVCRPDILSDDNVFLKEFISINLLNLLGLIFTITTGFAASMHLELRKMENQYKSPGAFRNTMGEIKRGSFALIFLFAFSIVLVVVKPMSEGYITIQSLMNSVGLIVMLLYVLVLIALMDLSFKIGPLDLDE